MKKLLLTTILVLLAVATVFAVPFRQRSVLRIRLSDNRPLTVVIDGRNFDRRGTSITIGDLPAGRHSVRIYSYRPYRDGGGGHARLLYSGTIRTRPGTITYCILDRNSGALGIRVRELDDSYFYNGRFRDNDPSWTDGYRDNDAPGNQWREGDKDRDNDDRYREDDRYNDDRRNDDRGSRNDDDNARPGSFRSNDMNDLQKRVEDRIGDTDKLKLMKSVLDRQTYTTAQVRTMAGWLSFDDTKTELLKWAYDNTTDKKNYWKLEDVLSFSSSKEELTRFLDGRK